MKTKILIISLLLSKIALSQELNNKLSLAGEELRKYKTKQSTSMVISAISAGLIYVGYTQEDAQPIIAIGGIGLCVGFTIKVSSLSNLNKSAKHLKEYER